MIAQSRAPFYREARKALAGLIQTQDLKLTECHTDTTGKRQACSVQADGKDVEAELVRQGMAWDWAKFSKGKYEQQESVAKSAKIGLWMDEKATTIHWKKRQR